MSYARWSNSCWYAFYNNNGCLSLWYDMDHIIDLDIDECKTVTVEDIVTKYGCTLDEAKEAMEYVKEFILDYEDA